MKRAAHGEPNNQSPAFFQRAGLFLGAFHIPYYIYILRSEESGILYTGHTSDLAKRLARHNDKSRITKRYTKKYEGNWALMHSEEYATRAEAMQRERVFLRPGKAECGSRKTLIWVGRVRQISVAD